MLLSLRPSPARLAAPAPSLLGQTLHVLTGIKRSLSTCILLTATALVASPAHAGKTVDSIKQRGVLNCGVATGVAGFAAPNSQGEWSGLDVDTCRAIAAALLGDAKKVEFVPLTSQKRFAALQSGEVDLLARNTTWTMNRDAAMGFHLTAINYFDGQAFLVPKKLNITSPKQLKNAEICVQTGTTTEKTLADYFRIHNLPYKPVVFDNFEASFKAFFAGRCQAYTTDASGLAALRNKEAKNPDDYVILPDLISKEPFAPVVRRGDDEWFAIVKWVIYGLVEAEENGITQANVEQLKNQSKEPTIQRILGTSEDTGKWLGLDRDWAVRAIKAVGNYGEVFERNVGPNSVLKMPRGLNRLWSDGGLMYAPPIR